MTAEKPTKPAATKAAASNANADIANLSYEAARDELVQVVTQLENGSATLEQSLALWERGEALAQRCETWLTGARARLDQALAGKKSE
ncbi:MAG: exodeoxyribonuclease VII small subunit [Actinomycetes bacterium]|jgi:exodeoxyribonuclease VII small subunit